MIMKLSKFLWNHISDEQISWQEYSDQSSDSSDDIGGQTCHQCKRIERVVIWCQKCDRRGYCSSCLSRWWDWVSIQGY